MRKFPKTWLQNSNQTSSTIGFGTSSAPIAVSGGFPCDIDLVILPSNDSGMTVTVRKGDAEGVNFLPVQVKNDDTDVSINGSTGIALTANTPIRVRINTQILSQIRLDLTGLAGSITAYIEGAVYDS